MIAIEEVEKLHSILIQKFGGSSGIRDKAVLASALARPFQTFDEKDLYPSIIDKAAAVFESILINHPFVDGNKRTGYLVLRLFLIHYNLDISASQDNKYEFVIDVASGTLNMRESFSGFNQTLLQSPAANIVWQLAELKQHRNPTA